MIIEAAALSDVGRKREANEDSYFLNEALGLYGVADGMGGHQAGEVASRLVVEAVQEALQHYMTEGLPPAELDHTLSTEAQLLAASIRKANRAVYGQSKQSETRQGMGTTLSLVYCTGQTLVAANVGDSPVYLFRAGHVEPLSQTHTVEAEMARIQSDRPNPFGGRYHHMLTRAVGIQETVDPSVVEVPCFHGDLVVICSDGLSNKVGPEEIRDVAQENSPEEACRILVGLANGRGGEDNITVLVLKLRKPASPLRSLLGLFTRRKRH